MQVSPCTKGAAMTSFATINAKELDHMDPNQGVILDVRTKMEHAEKHIGFGHAHVPVG
jgi:rhodanese-related sulfurtransferase